LLCIAWVGTLTGAPIAVQKPDIIRKGKECELRVWYFNKGTRSEGLHGELLIAGEMIAGKKQGDSVSCDLGEFIWHGTSEDRKLPFARSGWLPKDLSGIYPSWKTEPNQAPQTTICTVTECAPSRTFRASADRV